MENYLYVLYVLPNDKHCQELFSLFRDGFPEGVLLQDIRKISPEAMQKALERGPFINGVPTLYNLKDGDRIINASNIAAELRRHARNLQYVKEMLSRHKPHYNTESIPKRLPTSQGTLSIAPPRPMPTNPTPTILMPPTPRTTNNPSKDTDRKMAMMESSKRLEEMMKLRQQALDAPNQVPTGIEPIQQIRDGIRPQVPNPPRTEPVVQNKEIVTSTESTVQNRDIVKTIESKVQNVISTTPIVQNKEIVESASQVQTPIVQNRDIVKSQTLVPQIQPLRDQVESNDQLSSLPMAVPDSPSALSVASQQTTISVGTKLMNSLLQDPETEPDKPVTAKRKPIQQKPRA